ncbi:phosphate ABC transporter ATP-binding protein [Shewanella sp. Scap07]|uniref:phosphate ABC transporter ATP-binding protein n=1 Tax=Shewanella sp. Scap07 TaxID=2589987 RepID=UPI0015BBAE86|nr:phosphate ABC transporter ATP-binding protein [Shewanella sp. Scap07]QLE87470.1 phosphate ABC transporter ATP-binding protein [Shewanella sp. Scap07]
MHKTQTNYVAKVSELSIFFNSKAVVSEVDLTVKRNQIHVLCGASGSGKSTLLRAFNRLNDCFSNCKTIGSIALNIDGSSTTVQSLKSAQLPKLRRKVGMVFQHPMLLPGSIENNILMPLQVTRKLKGDIAREKLTASLKQAALWHEVKQRLAAPAQSLSGGQQQRLCLARTLALEPEILLLDEPTASLDPETTAEIEQLILTLKLHHSIIMVSHSNQQTKVLADQLSYLEHGRIV